MKDYNFSEIEKKWQDYWRKNSIYKVTEDKSKPKYYVLDMFPYPSGAGLHVGHPLGYIASDIYARFKRLNGFNVLHPMGYDAFGLPAEQYAIQTGQHPAITTEQNINRYREQLDKIGLSYDWSREVRTSDPAYYKWTQWIFIKLFHSFYNYETNKAEPINNLVYVFENVGFSEEINNTLTKNIEHDVKSFTADEWKSFTEKQQQDILMNFRLAFLAESYVNWCPALGTVLANDEVKDGVSERGGYPVERKLMMQWSLRITAYADRLLSDLDKLDWTESLKETQRNWIGKSEGTSLKFRLLSSEFLVENRNNLGGTSIEVFTTRPDTIFGVSFLTLAPEHELVEKLTTPDRKEAVEQYVTLSKNRSERERMADVKKISGEFTGSYAIHPFTGKQIPIWVGDYVLAGYGTGAVMAVPAHDSRDYAFAKHFGLECPVVILPPVDWDFEDQSYDEKNGKAVNSDFLNGLETKAAIKKAIEEIQKQELGKGKTNYRLRDAIFGRQRYWGEPIPIYYKDGIAYTLEENELPLLLPEVDKYLPTESGEPPLARAKDWKYKKPLSNSSQGERTNPAYQTAASSMWDSLKQNAQEHRKNPTEDESALWQYLKGEQLGVKFRRQHAIGFYIADFVCLDKMLVIEVDGKYHEQQIVDDQLRANDIQQQGFEIIRFTNEEVLVDTENVIEKIKAKLNSLPSRKSAQVLHNKEDLERASHKSGQGEDLGGASYPYEHSTMPGWAGSSWYFLRYMDNKNTNDFVSKEAVDYWKQIDLYVGGSEHATGHLLYFRFWTKFLFDLGLIPFDEPAKKLINQGMITGRSNFVYPISFSISLNVSPTGTDEEENFRNKILLEEQIAGEFEVFYVSELYYKNWESHKESVLNRVKEELKQHMIKRNYSIIEESIRVRKMHVNINYVLNDVLDTGAYKINELYNYPDATFILEDDGENQIYRCGWEIEKMSKSKYNVVTPDDIVADYGADTLRLYEMFLGPLEQSKPWNTQGIEGVHRFLKKLWKLFYDADGKLIVIEGEPSKKELKSLHKLIKKVGEDIENFSFNTSVPAFMICVNELTELKCNNKKILLDYLVCLSPYAPHVAEELWEAMGNKTSITKAYFPAFNPEYLIEDSFSYPISINGKHRTNIEMGMDMAQAEVEQIVLADEVVQKWLEGKQPKKIIFVKGKIVNMVI